MAIPIIVCDDSQMARKHLIRALPPEWPVDITQCAHGGEALDALRLGKNRVMFLDLTMPVLDGYQTLQAMRDEKLQCAVIVVSGDVQEQAVVRVLQLGALAFVRKPLEKDELANLLREHGLLEVRVSAPVQTVDVGANAITFRDCFREVCNVAMGRAAALLAKVMDVFVRLPIPSVNEIEPSELLMALSASQQDTRVSAVCQGYIASGIAGEALLLFHDASVKEIAALMKSQANNEQQELELFMDISSIIIGACLKGLAEQIDTPFSQGHPVVLGRHCKVTDIIKVNQARWKKMLSVEICYTLEKYNVSFDLLLLFTEDSIPRLQNKLAYMME